MFCSRLLYRIYYCLYFWYYCYLHRICSVMSAILNFPRSVVMSFPHFILALFILNIRVLYYFCFVYDRRSLNWFTRFVEFTSIKFHLHYAVSSLNRAHNAATVTSSSFYRRTLMLYRSEQMKNSFPWPKSSTSEVFWTSFQLNTVDFVFNVHYITGVWLFSYAYIFSFFYFDIVILNIV